MPKFVTVVCGSKVMMPETLWSSFQVSMIYSLELYVAGPCVLINLEKLFSGSKVRIVKEMSN